MQPKQHSDHELVKICMAALCVKAGFPDPVAMVQRDLQTLSDAIEGKTGVMISLSTIKRLLNGQFSRLPQIATLNALAQFLDYPTWQTFRMAHLSAAAEKAPENAPQKPSKKLTRRLKLAIPLIALILLGLLTIMLVRRPTLANLDKAQFSAVKVTGNDLPNSVIFHYNIDGVIADSFFIQQSWDKNRRIRIYKKNYTLTDIYYEPGYHVAKLIANSQIIKTVDVSIPTDGWRFYAREQAFSGRIVYIDPGNPIKSGTLQLTPEDLVRNKIDDQKYNAWFEVWFPTRIEYSSDDFILHCRVKVNNFNSANCPFVVTEVYCQRYFMYFENTPRGCTSELFAQFGDTILNGKTHDLSALGTDINQWHTLDLVVKNHEATVSIDGVKAYSVPFHASCGSITGLGFISNGLCSVDSLSLQTGKGQLIYHLPPAHPALSNSQIPQ